ncbi:MAG: FecCD family ABC transporter permease [Sulfolobales archaeon]
MAEKLYKIKIRSFLLIFFSLLLLSIFMILVSLSIGSSMISLIDIIRGGIRGFSGEDNVFYQIFTLRISRTLASYLTGLLLGLAGVLIQTMTRNPLSDPYILGLSTTALTFLAIALLIFPDLMIYRYNMIYVSFLGALAGYALTALLSRLAGGGSYSLILSGVAVSFLFGGLSHILLYIAQNKLRIYYLYLLMGSSSTVLLGDLWYLIYVFIASFIVSIILHRFLNSYVYGDEYAKLLGYRIDLLRNITIAIIAIATASTISIVGIVGFIGLASPHIARFLVGQDHLLLIPTASLIGGLLTLLADILVRLTSVFFMGLGELPLGIYTSLIGSPFLAYLTIRRVKQ